MLLEAESPLLCSLSKIDFLHVLALGASEYKLTPLFDHQAIHHHYPLQESFFTSDSVIIHVPFKSGDIFEVYQMEPLASSVNSSLMTLDSSSSVVLMHHELSLYATTRPSDFHSCRTEHLHVYFCSASLFLFLPVTGNTCEVLLTRSDASLALSTCPYRYLVPRPFFHTGFSDLHYFYFTTSRFVSVVCPAGTKLHKVSGHLAIRIACFLHSSNLTTNPERLYE